jgi:hypothetical protein
MTGSILCNKGCYMRVSRSDEQAIFSSIGNLEIQSDKVFQLIPYFNVHREKGIHEKVIIHPPFMIFMNVNFLG